MKLHHHAGTAEQQMDKGSELLGASMPACPEVNEWLLPVQKGSWISLVSSLQLHIVSNLLLSLHTHLPFRKLKFEAGNVWVPRVMLLRKCEDCPSTD